MNRFQNLVQAAKFGDLSELKQLIKRGADLNERDEDGKSLLRLVCEIGRLESAEILLEKGAEFVDANEKLVSAACGDIGPMVLEAIQEGADIDYVTDYLEATPLMIAADEGSLTALKILIEKKADLESRNEFGMTALYIAAWQGQPDCVMALIEAGADIDAPDQWGDSPIAGICGIEPPWEHAINTLSDDRLKSLTLLLEAGANPDNLNEDGLTPLDLAKKNTYISAANVLKNFCALEGKYLK